jgi:hypothetical protein
MAMPTGDLPNDPQGAKAMQRRGCRLDTKASLVEKTWQGDHRVPLDRQMNPVRRRSGAREGADAFLVGLDEGGDPVNDHESRGRTSGDVIRETGVPVRTRRQQRSGAAATPAEREQPGDPAQGAALIQRAPERQ